MNVLIPPAYPRESGDPGVFLFLSVARSVKKTWNPAFAGTVGV